MYLFFIIIARFLQLRHIFLLKQPFFFTAHFTLFFLTNIHFIYTDVLLPSFCAQFVTLSNAHWSCVDAAYGEIICFDAMDFPANANEVT